MERHSRRRQAFLFDLGTGRSLTAFNGLVWAAWRGEQGDPRLFFSSIGASSVWAVQAEIPQAYSDVGPALGVIGNKMVAAWKNAWDQTALYATYGGHTWSTPALIPNMASSIGPSLAFYNGKLYAAWKGQTTDQGIYFNCFDGSSWSAQTQISGVATNVGPSLAAIGGNLYAAWRGENTDQSLWWSWYNGTCWAPQAQIPWAKRIPGESCRSWRRFLL